MLREASKTKAARAETESKANPIERPEDVAALVEAALAEDLRGAVAVLLLLDTGMRVAEAEALTWGQVAFGTDGDGASRSIVIDRARVGADYEARPKSGRARRAALASAARRAAQAARGAVRARPRRARTARLPRRQLPRAGVAPDLGPSWPRTLVT